MVAVRVGDEDVGDLDPVALGPLQQRPQLVVAVDQHAGAALGVGDQVGVRQPLRVLGPLDDHCSSSVRGSRPRGEVTALPSSRVRATSSGSSQVGVWPTPGRTRKRAPAGRRSRLRRADQAVALAPGDRHRHVLGVAGRVEDVAAHRPVGAVVALGVDPAEDQLARRRRPGSAPGGRRRLEGGAARSAGTAGRARRAGAAACAQAESRSSIRAPPRPVRPAAAPEAGGGERGDRGGPADAAHFQRRPSRRASCRRRAGARPRCAAQLLVQRRAPGSRRSARPRRRQRRRRAEAGHVERDAPRARPRAAGSPGPRPLRVPPRPWISSSGSRAAGRAGAHRAPGFAKSACTSPIRRSRKPASEELR